MTIPPPGEHRLVLRVQRGACRARERSDLAARDRDEAAARRAVQTMCRAAADAAGFVLLQAGRTPCRGRWPIATVFHANQLFGDLDLRHDPATARLLRAFSRALGERTCVDAGLVDVDVIAATARLVEDVAADLPAIGRLVQRAVREAHIPPRPK